MNKFILRADEIKQRLNKVVYSLKRIHSRDRPPDSSSAIDQHHCGSHPQHNHSELTMGMITSDKLSAKGGRDNDPIKV